MANALEAASLVMIPSGYEDGTLGSLKPIDGSGDFTFTRGTDIGATRVAPDGYIEKGYENLLLQSNSFDTTWTNYSTTETSGQSGYDGSSDAWKLETTSNGNRYLQQLISINSVQSISIYAKSGTTDFLGIQIRGTGSGYSFFNLSNGTLGSSSSGVIDKNIELVNGTTDWYRCSFVINANTVSIRIHPTNADNNFASTTGQNIYIQDAQLNQGLAAMPYLPTTTTTSVGGILANQPRIDFTGGGCGSLLLEPSRTNLVPSEYFGALYTLGGTAIINNNTTSPEGLQNATKIYPTASGNYKHIRYSSLNPSTGVHTFSIFAKAGELDHLVLIDYDGGGVGVDFDLSTGVANDSASVAFDFVDMVDYGNGWYRCVATATNLRFYWILSDNGGVSVTANGTDGLYIYGAQAEQGSYPTSLIPTYGTSVTRAQDVCVDAGNSSTFNSSEGVLFFDGLFFESIIGNIISLSNGLTATGSVSFRTDSTNRYKFFVGSYNYLTPFNEYDVTERHKIALVWSLTSFKVFIDGVKKHDVSISFTPSASFSRLNLSNYQGTGKIVNGKAKQVLTFNTALSDADLTALTTI